MTRAKTFLGVTEIPGGRHNDKILGFWKSAHLGFKDDETPWCAGYANAQLEEVGIRGTRSGMAKSFLKWGRKLDTPMHGCIVVLHRPPNPASGHVGFFDKFVTRNGKLYVRVLGGNQGNKVSYALFPADRVAGYRWPASKPLPKPEAPDDGGSIPDDIPPPPDVPAPKVPETLNEPSATLPPAVEKTITVGTATTGILAPILAYLTDPWVILALGAVVIAVAVVVWWLYRRSGK
jgi:uncharacterized protein (TIGR02594 family)